MKIVLQRVKNACVRVDDQEISRIEHGFLLLIGVVDGDTKEQAEWLAQKIVKLRIFDGEDGKINDQSILDVDGSILVVSQFTLAGRVEKGNRPDYTRAAEPSFAKELYVEFINMLKKEAVKSVQSGEFGAYMDVDFVNDGPVTLLLEK